MSASTFPCRRHFAGIFSTSLVLAILALGLGLGAALGQDAQSSQDQSQPSQESAQPMGAHMHGRGGSMNDPNNQLKHLSKRLNLSDDQQTKIKPILEDEHKQMQQLWSDNSLSRQDRFSKMRGIRENSDAEIKKVLNEDQQKNFDKMREEQRSRMRERSGGNQPNSNDQPQ